MPGCHHLSHLAIIASSPKLPSNDRLIIYRTVTSLGSRSIATASTPIDLGLNQTRPQEKRNDDAND
jgi:hypothetical protein